MVLSASERSRWRRRLRRRWLPLCQLSCPRRGFALRPAKLDGAGGLSTGGPYSDCSYSCFLNLYRCLQSTGAVFHALILDTSCRITESWFNRYVQLASPETLPAKCGTSMTHPFVEPQWMEGTPQFFHHLCGRSPPAKSPFFPPSQPCGASPPSRRGTSLAQES